VAARFGPDRLAVGRFIERFIGVPLPPPMDSATGISFLQNEIKHKSKVRIVKTVFMCRQSIGRYLCLKLQKVGKGYRTPAHTMKIIYISYIHPHTHLHTGKRLSMSYNLLVLC